MGRSPQLRDDIRRVRQYELMTIFAPDLPEEDLQAVIERVEEIIKAAGGSVSLINRESPWGRRRLAYPIRHGGRDVRDGYYALYYADIDTQGVAPIERDLKLMDSLMRYLVTLQVAEQMVPQSELEMPDELPSAEPGVDASVVVAEPETEATTTETVVDSETAVTITERETAEPVAESEAAATTTEPEVIETTAESETVATATQPDDAEPAGEPETAESATEPDVAEPEAVTESDSTAELASEAESDAPGEVAIEARTRDRNGKFGRFGRRRCGSRDQRGCITGCATRSRLQRRKRCGVRQNGRR